MYTQPTFVILDKVEGYIRKYDSANYLALLHNNEKYERIFDRTRYLIMLKINISDVYTFKYIKIKINSFTFKKALTV